MRVTLMHNPESGDGQCGRKEIVAALESAGYSVTYQSTKEKGFADTLDKPGDFIVVAGGDGTIEKIARRMVGRSTPLALLPLGTANNVALSLGVSGQIDEIIAGWDPDHVRKIDLGFIRTPWDEGHFLESAGLGVFADLIARADARPLADDGAPRGQEFASAYSLIKQIVDITSPQVFSIRLDGVEYSGEYLLVELMNTPFIGPRLRLVAKSDPGDGLLEMVTVSEEERGDLVRFLSEHQHENDHSPPVTVRRGRVFEVEWSGARVHVDDEIWPESVEDPEVVPAAHDTTFLEVRVMPGELTVLA